MKKHIKQLDWENDNPPAGPGFTEYVKHEARAFRLDLETQGYPVAQGAVLHTTQPRPGKFNAFIELFSYDKKDYVT